jgi:hypothetical protein
LRAFGLAAVLIGCGVSDRLVKVADDASGSADTTATAASGTAGSGNVTSGTGGSGTGGSGPGTGDAGGAGGMGGGSPLDAGGGGAQMGGGRPDAGDSGGTNPGMCPPYVLPATCEPQYLNDAKNCCIPKRDCQGGACVQGKCQPFVIVGDASGDAQEIAVAGDWLVWATGCSNQLRRCAKNGAGEAMLPLGTHCTPTLAIGGDQAYWIEWNGPFLNAAPVDGSQTARVVAEVMVPNAQADFGDLVVDAQRAYWVTQETPHGVWYAPLNGNRAKAVAIASAQGSGLSKETAVYPNGVAVDDTFLFFSDEEGHTIKRRTLATLATDMFADVLVTGEGAPQRLALDAKRIYWVTGDGFVRSRLKDGPDTPATLASNQIGIWSIVVDDRYVYWTNYVMGGNVSRVLKTGGNVEVIATGQKFPKGLAQDCGTVYWTNQNDWHTGEVVKASK